MSQTQASTFFHSGKKVNLSFDLGLKKMSPQEKQALLEIPQNITSQKNELLKLNNNDLGEEIARKRVEINELSGNKAASRNGKDATDKSTQGSTSPQDNENSKEKIMYSQNRQGDNSENVRKSINIEGISYNHEKKKCMFKVACDEKSTGGPNLLSREEVLKIDPLLLLYFYEKSLQFDKSPDFKSENLKKFDGIFKNR